ncbi:MAG: photosystem II reaction center protein J [Geitlerinemataceae cyanobacterium]
MSDVRIPLWVVGTIAGLGALSVAALLFYGSYTGLGSAQ